jgi:CubicO group peptidase (beta-lactamase class C family)
MWSKEHPPGAWFQYANLPWGLVASIMETVAGQAFDPLMRRLVLGPLGMGGSYDAASLPAARRGDLATLYRKANAGDVQVWDPKGPWVAQADDFSAPPPPRRTPPGYVAGTNGLLGAPQGGLRASARDLFRVMRMLLDEGRIGGEAFLRPATLREMFSRQWVGDGRNGQRGYSGREEVFNAWGLGVQHFGLSAAPGRGDRLVSDNAFRALGHHGDAYGLRSLLAFDPATREGIVMIVGGTGFDPAGDPGEYSWAPRFEERIVEALWRRAIRRRAD